LPDIIIFDKMKLINLKYERKLIFLKYNYENNDTVRVLWFEPFKSVAVDINKYRIYTTVEWNGSPLYAEIYEAGDLKEEFDEIKDDFQEFAKLMFKTTDRIPRLVGNRIDQIEKRIREKFPEVVYVDIEID
jgi:hypothetical protein